MQAPQSPTQGPWRSPYNQPDVTVFPKNMQPPPPKPPKPPPTGFFQGFMQQFGKSYARQAKFGYASVGRAAQSAFTAVAPEAAIPLAVAREGLDTIKLTIKSMNEFKDRILEANKRLGQYNGQVAIAYTRLAIGDFWRDVGLANRTAPSSEMLVKAVNRMRDSFQEFRVAQSNILNGLAMFQARFQGNLAEAFSPFVAKLNELMGRNAGGGAFELFADFLTINITTMAKGVKFIAEWLGMKFPDPAAAAAGIGPWDDLAGAILQGKVGGALMPGAGPRPLGVIAGPPARFGRGI